MTLHRELQNWQQSFVTPTQQKLRNVLNEGSFTRT